MAGYAVVFDSIFTGTLCGKYPDTAAWMFLLALKDKNGVVDMTPQYISSVTGMPVADLMACIARFMEPDPHSRSTVEQGRRLVPLSTERDWGWRLVNHAAYRERARLISKNEREVGTGANRQRLSKTAAHRRSPPKNASDPLSDADADADAKKSKRGALRASRVPADFAPDLDFARREIPDIDVDREAQKFRDWEFKTPRSDWPACWRTWVENCRTSGRYARKETAQWR